jgi:hypothetical protein
MSDNKHRQTFINEYEEAVDAIPKIANYTHGVKISDQTHELWRQTMLMIYYVDKATDEQGVDDVALAQELEDFFLSSATSKKWRYLNSRILSYAKFLKENLSAAQASILINKEKKILAICSQYATTSSARAYSKLVMEVGQTVAEIFFAETSSFETSQPQFDKFKDFFRYAGRISTIIDALTDLETDFAEDLVKVQPTLLNRIIIVACVIPDTLKAVRRIGFKKLYKLIKTTDQKNKEYHQKKLLKQRT